MNQRAFAEFDYGRVAVLMGGPSAEHDISLNTGNAVVAALCRQGVETEPLVWDDDIIGPLMNARCDRVFNALHGRGGEDGTIQGVFEVLGLAYTGSGVMASALAMDKARTKAVWRAAGIPTPESVVIDRAADPEHAWRRIDAPCFVKPARDGSSFGISRVDEAAGAAAAVAAAARYDSQIIVERAIEGSEYTIGILGRDVLPTIRLETSRPFYDYEAKYVGSQTDYIIPSGLGEAQERELGALALTAFDAVGAYGWARLDFMLDEGGRAWFLEINTVPGLTDHSLVPMAARAAGIDFDELVLRILYSSVSRAGDTA